MPAPDFADYVRERRPALLRAAHAIAADPDNAEDLLQVSLVKVGARWGTLRNRGAADAYVRRTMRNQQTSWYREKWRRLEVVTDDPHERGVGDCLPEPPALHLWPLVATLPPRQRATVALRFYEGLTEAETARALGCSVGTVKSSTSRGLAALRRKVAEAGYPTYGDLAG